MFIWKAHIKPTCAYFVLSNEPLSYFLVDLISVKPLLKLLLKMLEEIKQTGMVHVVQ